MIRREHTDSTQSRSVRLLPLSEEWVDQLISWRAQEEARQHQPVQPLTREQLLNFIKDRRSDDLAELASNEYILIIADEETGRGVGWITIEVLSRMHGLARIGYTIDRDHYNRGYATAAVRTLVRSLFTGTGVQRVEADCAVGNPASRRVLEKCGFRLVGVKRKYLVIHDRRVDHHNFELCRDDWKGTHG